jgi:Ca2+:H+ antiporter
VSDQPLSEGAERVLGDARAEAERLGHEFIGSEHLLLGLLRSSSLAQSSLDAAGIDRAALATALESGQKRVRVRSDAPQAEGVPLSSHARRLLEAGAAGDGPLEGKLLLAALTDRRGALTRFLGDKGISADVVIAEVATRAGLRVPVLPPPPPPREPREPRPPRAEPAASEAAPKPPREEKAPREPKPPREPKQRREEKPRREKQERPSGEESWEREERSTRPVRATRPEEAADPTPAERRQPSVGKLAPKPKPKVSWFRMLLLLAVPAAIVLNYMHAAPILVFLSACIGVLPLAGFMGEATEQIAARSGPTLGGLLNATFGNAAELIIAIVALQAGLVDLVKASITGSILGNLLLILGLSIVAGGLKRPELKFNRTSAGMSAGMLMLAVVSLVLPALFKYSHPEPSARMDGLHLAEGVAIVLLITYAASLLFTLKTHKRLIGGEPHLLEGERWSMGRAIMVLGLATVGIAVMSEILVHATEAVTADLGLSQMFLGLIIIPLIGNAAEHATAITVARKGQIDLSLQIALGSSTQIALLVAPLLVFISLFFGHPMNLVFQPFEVAILFLATLVTAIVTLDGESHWFEGVQLLAVYAMIAVAAYFI